MHKAEILSDSLLLISLEQPAPRLAQNQKQPRAEYTALQKKDVDTNAGSGVKAQWDQPGQPGAAPARSWDEPRREKDISGKRDVDNKAGPHPQIPACQTLQPALLCQALKTFTAQL